jgi:hypothetical protein
MLNVIGVVAKVLPALSVTVTLIVCDPSSKGVVGVKV